MMVVRRAPANHRFMRNEGPSFRCRIPTPNRREADECAGQAMSRRRKPPDESRISARLARSIERVEAIARHETIAKGEPVILGRKRHGADRLGARVRPGNGAGTACRLQPRSRSIPEAPYVTTGSRIFGTAGPPSLGHESAIPRLREPAPDGFDRFTPNAEATTPGFDIELGDLLHWTACRGWGPNQCKSNDLAITPDEESVTARVGKVGIKAQLAESVAPTTTSRCLASS